MKGLNRTLLVQMKTRKLENFKSKRGQPLPQSLYHVASVNLINLARMLAQIRYRPEQNYARLKIQFKSCTKGRLKYFVDEFSFLSFPNYHSFLLFATAAARKRNTCKVSLSLKSMSKFRI